VSSHSESCERNCSDEASEGRFAMTLGGDSGAVRVAGLVAVRALVRGMVVL
jgi:hypothetical protein